MEGKRHLWLLLVSLCRRKQPLPMTYCPVRFKSVTPNKVCELLHHSSLSKRVRLLTENGLLRPVSCCGSFHLPPMGLKSLERLFPLVTVANFSTTTTLLGTGTSPADTTPTSSSDKSSLSKKILPKENIWTIPNALCVMRIGMAPVAAHMILNNQFGPALGVFAVAGVTDLLDGWIARVVPGQATVMGSFLDPMADKILVGTLFLSLTYMDLIPVLLTGLIIGRDAILILSGFYIRYLSLDPPSPVRHSSCLSLSSMITYISPSSICFTIFYFWNSLRKKCVMEVINETNGLLKYQEPALLRIMML